MQTQLDYPVQASMNYLFLLLAIDDGLYPIMSTSLRILPVLIFNLPINYLYHIIKLENLNFTLLSPIVITEANPFY